MDGNTKSSKLLGNPKKHMAQASLQASSERGGLLFEIGFKFKRDADFVAFNFSLWVLESRGSERMGGK
jgi:hypothetical protein